MISWSSFKSTALSRIYPELGVVIVKIFKPLLSKSDISAVKIGFATEECGIFSFEDSPVLITPIDETPVLIVRFNHNVMVSLTKLMVNMWQLIIPKLPLSYR